MSAEDFHQREYGDLHRDDQDRDALSVGSSSRSPVRAPAAAYEAAQILHDNVRRSASIRQDERSPQPTGLDEGDHHNPSMSPSLLYESHARRRMSEHSSTGALPRRDRSLSGGSPQSPAQDDSSAYMSSDPFAPNKELYQAFVRSAGGDNTTRLMAERLMQQLSDLSRKVGTLTTALDQQKQANVSLQSQVRAAHGNVKPEDATLHKFLFAIRESSVQLATQLNANAHFAAPDEQLNTAITTISAALETCSKTVSSCRRTADSLLGSAVAAPLDSQMAAIAKRGIRGVDDSAHDDVPNSEHNVLSRVIDILGGDASQYTTIEELRQAAPLTATKARSSLEHALRENNTTSVALREYERRAQQMLKACGVSIVPSAQELLDNGGVGGRSSFDKCLESAQWLQRAMQQAEQRAGMASMPSGSVQERLSLLLQPQQNAEDVIHFDAVLRSEVVPLLPGSVPRDAPYTVITEALTSVLTDSHVSARQSPRRQASAISLDADQADVLLGELLDEVDALATDRSDEWAGLSQRLGFAMPSTSTPTTTPSKGRRSVTHGDVSRALGRLKERLSALPDIVERCGANKNNINHTNASLMSPQADPEESEVLAANQRALHNLAQLIPKTTISGAAPTQQRAKNGSLMTSTVLPPTDSLDEMVQLISERIELLHQGLQKAYKQSDGHRTDKARLEELIQLKAPIIAKTLHASLVSIRNANPEEDIDNGDVEGVLINGQMVEYPVDSMDAAHNYSSFFEPIMSDVAARAEALKTKCARLSNNHRTDRQRIANYASSQAITLKRWQKTVNEVISIARLMGVDTSELARSLGDEQPGKQPNEALPPNSASTTLCADVLRKVQSRLQEGITPEMAEEGGLQTALNDLREQAATAEAQRRMFAKTISVMLLKLAEVGRSMKRCMYAFGPDATDYDEVMEEVLTEGRVATSDEDEEALGTIIKKLVRWSARMDIVSSDHLGALQKSVRYFNGAHAVLCHAEAEVHDANILDADETLVRIADGLLMALNDKPDERTYKSRVPEEITPDGEGRFVGADQDHRLMRIHSVVTKLHQSMDALLRGRYLAIPGLMDEESGHAESSPSRAQTAFLDIDPEVTALTTTELVRLVEQNLRHVDGCLSRFSIGHKQAAIYIQKDVDGMQAELAAMLGHLSQFDVQDTFGISRDDLRAIYDVLKDKSAQRGSYFFNRADNGDGNSPWVTALGYLGQTYGPTLEMLAAKAESQRWFKRIVDQSMDEAAAYIQWCRDEDIPLPKQIQDNTINATEIELVDEHLPVVIQFASEKAKSVQGQASDASRRRMEHLQSLLDQERKESKENHGALLAQVEALGAEVAELNVQKDALISEAAMARAQLRRVNGGGYAPQSSSHAIDYGTPRAQDGRADGLDARAAGRGSRIPSDLTATPRRRDSTPKQLPSAVRDLTPRAEGSYASRHAAASRQDGGAARRASPSRLKEESMQAVASHPTVKQYVRALCDELENRHRTSPQRTSRNQTPLRGGSQAVGNSPVSYHSTGPYVSSSRPSPTIVPPSNSARSVGAGVYGPRSYEPSQRSEHHRMPIASANTCPTTHRDSPDRHCKRHGHDRSRTRSPLPAAERTESPQVTPHRSNSVEGAPHQKVVVMPRTVMIVGPRHDVGDEEFDGDDMDHRFNNGSHGQLVQSKTKDASVSGRADVPKQNGSMSKRPITVVGRRHDSSSLGDAVDTLMEVYPIAGRMSGRRRLSADVSPAMSDINDNAMGASQGNVHDAGNHIVHVRNSEMDFNNKRPASERRSRSTNRWRL